MFAQQLVNGFAVGSIYALFALGFTLMFGVLGVVNLVYGVYFSAGAFIALFASDAIHAPIWLAGAVAAVATGAGAVAIDGVLLAPLRRAKAPELASLMVTLGATLLIYSLAGAALGTDIRRFRPDAVANVAFQIGGARVSLIQIVIVATVGFVVAGLLVLLNKTKLVWPFAPSRGR